MASAREFGRRARQAVADRKQRLGRRAAELGTGARGIADEVRSRVEASRRSAGPEGWRPARLLAGAAGVFLLWRAVFGRGLARLPGAIAGLAILRRAFPRAARRAGESRRAAGDRGVARPEVTEVKSPAELERGTVSGSPRPTS